MVDAYKPQNFERLLGTPGFSDKLLRDHFKLYEGYVKNTNEILGLLSAGRSEGAQDPHLSEIRRRFGWEFDGMRLHEYYFGSIGKEQSSLPRGSVLARKISEDFFSFESWKKDFLAVGAMRGIGWVLLSYDPTAGRLFNVWIDEHDRGHLAGTEPILVMDVFEHAFIADYGIDKAKYLASFWSAIRWTEVERRFEATKETKHAILKEE